MNGDRKMKRIAGRVLSVALALGLTVGFLAELSLTEARGRGGGGRGGGGRGGNRGSIRHSGGGSRP